MVLAVVTDLYLTYEEVLVVLDSKGLVVVVVVVLAVVADLYLTYEEDLVVLDLKSFVVVVVAVVVGWRENDLQQVAKVVWVLECYSSYFSFWENIYLTN